MKKLAYIVGPLIVTILSVVLFSRVAHAAAFTVTSVDDDPAVDPTVSCNTAGDVCTLRSAIEAANAQAGNDDINFNIPGGGVQTIAPASALPTITERVAIMADTQPGASCGTLVPDSLPGTNTAHTLLVELSASNIPSTVLLHLANGSDNSRIDGFVMNGTTGFATALQIDSTVGGTLVQCNYFGTNAAGDTLVANSGVDINAFINNGTSLIQNNLISGGLDGIQASSATIQSNLIGTDVTGLHALANSAHGIYTGSGNNVGITHNVISGNSVDGINMQAGQDNHMTDNYIGLNLAGNPLGNGGAGISAFGTNDFTIGSTLASNFISANAGDGIHIFSNCTTGHSIGSTTIHNYIGTNTAGGVQAGYGNGGAGVEVNEYEGSCGSVYNHSIGGDSASQPPNVIAGNSQQGILVHQDTDHDVFSITMINNSIYGNGQFGIDLAADSENTGTANTDLGPNPLNALAIAYPTSVANYYLNTLTINSNSVSGNNITINYNFQAPSITDNPPVLLATDLVGYRIDFYLNDGAQDGAYAGYAQGKTHLGSFIVNGSETGATHTFTSPVPLTGNQNITATSTVLWQKMTCPNDQDQAGFGPPYDSCTPPPS